MNQQGVPAENQAAAYLQQQGLTLLQRNYQTRRGEIDLIMRDQDTLVFVEVRYRRQADYGHALETITHRKQHKLITAAQYYLLTHPQAAAMPCRFDVVAIMPGQLDWIRNAFGL